MRNFIIKELRVIDDDTVVRQMKKEAMTVDDLLYDLQGSISKGTSKQTKEIRITIKEIE